MRKNNKLITLLVVAVLLAGTIFVYILNSKPDESELIVEQSTQVNEIVLADTEVPVDEIQESAEPTPEAVVEEQVPPTPRAGLESTDPATVNLASGELQLVEAFAFW